MNSSRRVKSKGLLKVLAGLVGFAVLFLCVMMIFVKSAYDDHFRRTELRDQTGYLRYEDVPEIERSVVKFMSGKNELTGYLYGEETEKGLVVIAHGLGYGAEDYLPETLYFLGQGWRVFAYDATGTYASEGDSTVGLPQSLLDLQAALAFVDGEEQLKDLPLVLFGHSWGGYAVAAVLNTRQDVAGVVSLAGYDAPEELLRETLEAENGAFGALVYPFAWVYQQTLFGSTAQVRAVEGINRGTTPVMVLHGTEDQEISYAGASLLSHAGEIHNPNVIAKTCSEAGRNGHNDLLISQAAQAYIDEKNEEYAALLEQYPGEIPGEAKAAFYAGLDRQRTSELDQALMGEIEAFFERCVESVR